MIVSNDKEKKVTRVIDNFCELEWRRGGAHKNTENQLKYPPIILWRFKSPESEQAKKVSDIVSNAVDAFQGRVKWDIEFLGRNWVLLPTEYINFSNKGNYRKDVEAISDFVKLKPEIGRLANFDVPDLAGYIQIQLDKELGDEINKINKDSHR